MLFSRSVRGAGNFHIRRASSTLASFQFSLARLMLLITVVAIVLGLAVTIHGFVPLIFVSLVWCVLPTPLVICALFGAGDVRAFAIGGLIPWVLLLRGDFPAPSLWIPVWLVVMPAVCGIVAVATHRWIRRRH